MTLNFWPLDSEAAWQPPAILASGHKLSIRKTIDLLIDTIRSTGPLWTGDENRERRASSPSRVKFSRETAHHFLLGLFAFDTRSFFLLGFCFSQNFALLPLITFNWKLDSKFEKICNN